MDEIADLLCFDWRGTKKNRYTTDKWSDDKNCRPLKNSAATAQGLLTGNRQLDKAKRFKLIAVDLDKKDNWDEVVATYQKLELPESLTVQTPSGGYHILFWIPKNIKAQNINDDRHCTHFELKGDNGNITAPGSVFDDGATYIVVKDVPIARLFPVEAYRLCKYKKEWHPPVVLGDAPLPDQADVDANAYRIDERARKNPRGWQLRCPYHDDKQASAILFYSGWLYCSGCGHSERIVRKEGA